jgi:hypothetical protein
MVLWGSCRTLIAVVNKSGVALGQRLNGRNPKYAHVRPSAVERWGTRPPKLGTGFALFVRNHGVASGLFAPPEEIQGFFLASLVRMTPLELEYWDSFLRLRS